LHDKRRTDDDEARQHDDEDRRSVAGVDERIVEAARLALRLERQKSGEHFSLAAARAAGGEARDDRIGWSDATVSHLENSLCAPLDCSRAPGLSEMQGPIPNVSAAGSA